VNAQKESPEIRTLSGNNVSTSDVKRPEVRPDLSYMGSLRDAKDRWWDKTIRTIIQGIIPFGIVGFACFAVRSILHTENMDNGSKVVGVFAITLAVVIWGIATLLIGAKTDAKNSQEESDHAT